MGTFIIFLYVEASCHYVDLKCFVLLEVLMICLVKYLIALLLYTYCCVVKRNSDRDTYKKIKEEIWLLICGIFVMLILYS